MGIMSKSVSQTGPNLEAELREKIASSTTQPTESVPAEERHKLLRGSLRQRPEFRLAGRAADAVIKKTQSKRKRHKRAAEEKRPRADAVEPEDQKKKESTALEDQNKAQLYAKMQHWQDKA